MADARVTICRTVAKNLLGISAMGLPGCEPSQGSTLLFPLAALDLLWRGLCGQPIGDYVN
jgi:hypothetical protein